MKALRFIHQLQYEDLPNQVIEMARACLLDLLAVAAAGSHVSSTKIMCDFVASEMSGQTAILFSDKTASNTGAALAIGTMIDSFDAHDGQVLCKGHVGAGIFPALTLFVGNPLEKLTQSQARELIVATVIGYELGSRLGIALHATTSDYHTSGAWNSIAAAAIVARALGLSDEQTEHALGIAEYHGPRSQMMRCIDYPTMLKDGSGFGAMVGVSSALLAQKGFTGAPAVTLFDSNCQRYFADLGQRWYSLEQYFKLYPVCRWAQPAVEAALTLREKLTQAIIDADAIKRIEIYTFHEAVRLDKKYPKNTEEAQYGLAFPFICALLFGDINVQHITNELDNPQILRLIDKIELLEKYEYNTLFPAERWAEVIIHLDSGEQLKSPAMRTKGDFDNPYPESVLTKKAEKLLQLVLDDNQVQRLITHIKKLGA